MLDAIIVIIVVAVIVGLAVECTVHNRDDN